MQNKSQTLVAAVLFSATFAALAYVFLFPVLLAAIVGFLIAFVPLPFLRLTPMANVAPIMGALCFALLAVVAASSSYLAYAQTLGGDNVSFQAALPLLLTSVGLYAFYSLINWVTFENSDVSVPDRLTSFFSGPPLLLTLAMALTVTSYILLAFNYLGGAAPEWRFLSDKFLDRGIIPPLTLLLFIWGLLLLISKSYFVRRESRALSKAEGRSTLFGCFYQNTEESVRNNHDDYFALVWKKSADFYVIPRYLNWAIPILGFIGTVLGISLAADGIQKIFSSSQGLASLSSQLGSAISPLGIAFDTTLIALSLSVVLMFFQTALQRWEDNIIVNFENQARTLPKDNMSEDNI